MKERRVRVKRRKKKKKKQFLKIRTVAKNVFKLRQLYNVLVDRNYSHFILGRTLECAQWLW